MERLTRTQNELRNFPANQEIFGSHMAAVIRPNSFGLSMGETEFKIERDLIADPYSFNHAVDGEEYVSLNRPVRAMSANVIVDQTELAGDRIEHNEERQFLKFKLASMITDSMTGVFDSTALYLIGDNSAKRHKFSKRFETIKANNDPAHKAKRIAEITRQGVLTFLLSDSLYLPLSDRSAADFPATIALKTKLPEDLAIKPGKLSRRGKGIIDFSSSSKADRALAADLLTENEQRIDQSLKSRKIKVVQAVFDRTKDSGFDVSLLDRQIAKAIRSIASRY